MYSGQDAGQVLRGSGEGGGALVRLAERVVLGLAGPRFGDTRRAALVRRLPGPLRRRDLVIPFGVCAGTPFNAGGSAPSFALGISEPRVQAALRDLLRPGDVFYDIGANVGFCTVLGARRVGPHGRVYSFEPLPDNVTALRHNIALSGLPNVTVLACALADRRGPALLTPAGEPFWARLSILPPPPGARAAIPVACRSVDELVRGGRIAAPHVVKIDVEGAEPGVLRGMAATLRTARPVVVCEIHGTGEEIRALLTAAGYTVRPLRHGARRTASRHVLAVPAPDRGRGSGTPHVVTDPPPQGVA
ncbi:FkbM family methyltransferase [Streptomyces sp. 4F14]|uniref:FkbM family methyltransferase n=1 Tax=Streptomyces sp. 4F14 TaxID=3394380 RepID=UPI003A8B8AEA